MATLFLNLVQKKETFKENEKILEHTFRLLVGLGHDYFLLFLSFHYKVAEV
jgi:hypothetical protein